MLETLKRYQMFIQDGLQSPNGFAASYIIQKRINHILDICEAGSGLLEGSKPIQDHLQVNDIWEQTCFSFYVQENHCLEILACISIRIVYWTWGNWLRRIFIFAEIDWYTDFNCNKVFEPISPAREDVGPGILQFQIFELPALQIISVFWMDSWTGVHL